MVSSDIHHTDIMQHTIFHQPSMYLTKYQKGMYCLEVKVFNVLPFYIKMESDNPK